MPGIVRDRASLEADDDDASASSTNGGDAIDTPRPREANKRPRLSNGTDGAVDDSWILSPPGTAHANRTRTPAARVSGRPSTNGVSRPSNGSSRIVSEGPLAPAATFKPGQLLKVHLRNFVTYTDATFYPGPFLNMIIGPNGTGKSTLVCAICIGLGFSTAHLGRAKELSEFVKHGARDSTIQISLKGMPGEIDPEIRLDFVRDGEKKQWQLGGKTCRATDIKNIISRLGIQIDNLCHFLPQDRVVEFSRLSPKDRLISTLRAAAPGQVTNDHEELKRLAGQRAGFNKEQNEKKTNLLQLKKRQDGQRQEVERMRERQEVLKEVQQLEKLQPIAKHMEHRRAHEEAKAEKQTKEAELALLNEQVEPFDRARKKKEAYLVKVNRALELRRKLCSQLETQVKKAQDEQEKADSDKQAVSDKRRAETESFKSRTRQVQKVRHDIGHVEAQMEQQPVEIDAAEYNRRINAKVREIRDQEQVKADIREGGRDRQQQLDGKKHEIRQTQQDLENLSSLSGQQIHKLRQLSNDTARAWEWIENNRHQLKGEVYGPALLTCTVKDKKYAPIIESLLGKMDFLRITCTTFEDFKFLGDHLAKNMGLADFAITNIKGGMENSRPHISEAAMRELGLEGWAVDYLEGPDAVLAMLCDGKNLHNTGVCWRDVDDQQYAKLSSSELNNWVTSKSFYRTTKRAEYGPGATSTRVMQVSGSARYWSSQGVDVSVEMDLKQRLAELQDQVGHIESTQGDSRTRLDEVQRTIKRLEDEKEEIQTEKDDKQRHNAQLAALPHKLTGLKNKLKDFENMETEFHSRLDQLTKEREQLILNNGQVAINYANLVDTLRAKHAEVVPAAIAVIEAESDVEQLKKQHADATQGRDRLKKEIEEVKRLMSIAKQKALDSIQEWKAHTLRDPELQDYFDNLTEEQKTRTPQELSSEVQRLEGRLEMLPDGNSHLIKEFEDRGRRIERLENDVQASATKLQELQQQIMDIRRTWEPQIEALVESISNAFSDLFARIRCAGSVQLYKPGAGGGLYDDDDAPRHDDQDDELRLEDGHDYENWAIQILVKFREHEALSVLDSQRQSGGERAVTTIYYLMALQKLSRAPFRVVDEINQGMDPRNERIVHERMVDMSCGADDAGEDEDFESQSQYFLITPKLLPGLKYKRGMKVHCIASGEFMPKVNKHNPAMDFPALLAKKRAANVGTVVAGA